MLGANIEKEEEIMLLVKDFDEIKENDIFYIKDETGRFDRYKLVKKNSGAVAISGSDKGDKPFAMGIENINLFVTYGLMFKDEQ